MTIKEAREKRKELDRFIKEYESGMFLKHEFLQAEWFPVRLPEGDIIKFRVKQYAQHMWRTIFYAEGAKQAIADLESLRDAIEDFLTDFRPWAEQKEANHERERV